MGKTVAIGMKGRETNTVQATVIEHTDAAFLVVRFSLHSHPAFAIVTPINVMQDPLGRVAC